jgi:phosphoglycolate phosphatase
MKHILFDLDGTLTDPKEGITRSIRYALKKLDHPTPDPDELLWCIGPPLLNSFKTILNSNQPDLAQKALALYRERFDRVGKFENRVYTDVPELLEKLKSNGYTLFVATSKPMVFARQIVDHFELAPYFDEVFGSRLNGELAEKAALIQFILDLKKIRATEAIMVGDRKYDIIGAQKCGVATIGVTYGYGSIEEVQTAAPDTMVDRPMAVETAINDLAAAQCKDS